MFILQNNPSTDVEKATSQNTEIPEAEMVTSENFDNLLGHIIWPLTILIIFLIFRKNLSQVFNRLGSIEASATGVSLGFIDKEIEAVEAYQESESQLMSKSAVSINSGTPSKTKINSPHYQLLTIRSGLRDVIVKKAEENDVDIEGKSSLELRDDLIDKGKLSPRNAHVFTSLINLTSTAGPDISKEQVSRINKLYKNLSL